MINTAALSSAQARSAIRKRCLAARRALSTDERRAKSAEISRRIAESEVYKAARVIMLYKAMPDEAEIILPENSGKRFVYPRCIGDGLMRAYEPKSDSDWEVGAFGITEPKDIAENLADPSEIDLVICPCSGFDKQCNRLGMGKGYYDRFLPLCVNAHISAAAFEVQRSESVLPTQWDVRMESVFTEKRRYTAQI